MTTLTPESSLLLSRYADGELTAAQVAEAEALLERDPQAVIFLSNLHAIADVTRQDIADKTGAARFDGLMANLWAEIDPAPQVAVRDAELEMLAMAMADGESLDDADRARVDAYLAATPAAADAYAGLAELRMAVRLPLERALDRVDFDSLSARISAAVEREATTTALPARTAVPETPGLWQRLAAFFGGQRAAVLCLATAAVTAAVLIPAMRQNTSEPVGAPTVINNYYITSPTVESVSYERGFWGGYQAGNEDNSLAPVIWIAPEALVDAEGSSLPDEYFGTPL